MTEYKFYVKGNQVIVRYRKSAWFLSYFDRQENEGHMYRFSLQPRVRELVEYWTDKNPDALFSLLMSLPHEEIKK